MPLLCGFPLPHKTRPPIDWPRDSGDAFQNDSRVFPVSALKRHSIGLLLGGIGLVLGSCVPLAQTIWTADSGPVQHLDLPPGSAAPLHVAEALTAAPVVVVATSAGAAGTLAYTFSIRDVSGGALIEESGSVPVVADPGEAGRPASLRLRFRELTIPAGEWSVRLDTGNPAGWIRAAELRLGSPSPGLVPALMTSLVLAILGWLAASLGALQWIRAEAARPAADAPDEPARAWTVGCHLSALLGYILPFGHILGPLVIWLNKRHSLPAVERAGRNALNFQLSVTLYVLAALLLSFFLIGIAVLFVVVVFHFAVVLYAALRAQRGLEVTYPFSIRII